MISTIKELIDEYYEKYNKKPNILIINEDLKQFFYQQIGNYKNIELKEFYGLQIVFSYNLTGFMIY